MGAKKVFWQDLSGEIRPSSFSLLNNGGWWTVRGRVVPVKRRVWCIAAFFGLLIFVVFLFLSRPPWALLAKLLVVDDRPEKVDVLIVLAGDSERDLYAAELYRLGLAPKIIMSGCGPTARQMADRAVKAGVRAQDIIMEEKSESTYENAVYSRDIVLTRNFKSAIVVTSPYHMRRTRLVFGRVFRNTGVRLLYCSTRDSEFNTDGQCKSETDRQIVRREYLKLIYYWFRYW
ncbi:MAG: YdcF family protein [Firmicutes bacterium]|nr:YdcF family protein [Bacillota bacterium]